jgi:hypothetical protein
VAIRAIRALIVVVGFMFFLTWALYEYYEARYGMPLQEMARIKTAVEQFYATYGRYPAGAGPISSQIYSELSGSAAAVINIKHQDFLTPNSLETGQRDAWGHPFVFKVGSGGGGIPHVIIISCGPNGVYENGDGDDLHIP